MKAKYMVLVAGMLTALLQVQAAEPESRSYPSETALTNAVKNYQACLSSENNGVLESGIAQVIRFRILYPGRDMTVLHRTIDDLTITGSTPEVRYMAYLAGAVFDNPGLIADGQRVKDLGNEHLFALIADRLQETLIGYSVR